MAGDESHTNVDGLQFARSEALALARGTVLAGRYEIEATLGRGGAGVVLRAHDRELREAVAIKLLRPDLGNAARWIERLAREVKLARQLRHPNVCRVFDFEKADGHVFIVMELATGGTLRSELDEARAPRGPSDPGARPPRPFEARLADARAVAAGLAAIHEAGIAHRDVTPQNVLRMSDGRLVVSDFGLATEVSETTTSIHGGTIAYMAPEVVRGQRASFASDVWALGVVIHEIVFGERPTWSKPVGGTLAPPRGGRTLTREERLAFEVCRACTAELPAQRYRSAREVEAGLAGERRTWRHARRSLAASGLVVLVAALAWLGVRLADRAAVRQHAPNPAEPPTIEIEPGGADWTTASKVLASYDDESTCLVGLPDGHTLRYVIQNPPRAFDLDTRSGIARPSRLVAQTFEQGCPDVSPRDGRLVFQGRAADGSAHAFVSSRQDGADAVPTAAIAEPSVSSEPVWTPDGDSFLFDADGLHAGAFSMSTRRTTILPEPSRSPYLSFFKFATGQHVFLDAVLGDQESLTEVVGLAWPSLQEEMRFRLPGFNLSLRELGGTIVMSSQRRNTLHSVLVEVDPKRGRARTLGRVADQSLRDPVLVEGGLAFRSWSFRSDAWSRPPGGAFSQLTHEGLISEIAPCGEGFVGTQTGDQGVAIVRLNAEGVVVARLTEGGEDHSPSCAPSGDPWFYVRGAGEILRCEGSRCRSLLRGNLHLAAASPDGRRLLLLRTNNAGPLASWMSSEGGTIHDVGMTDTVCRPGWSTSSTVWISRQRAAAFQWTEVDLETGRETGRVAVGTTNCSHGPDDPVSPVLPDLRIRHHITTEIRLAPRSFLGRPWTE